MVNQTNFDFNHKKLTKNSFILPNHYNIDTNYGVQLRRPRMRD